MRQSAATPRISVIIPVYNAEPYLARCLDGLIRQTYEDFEILCVNDGSTDRSAAILHEYAAKDGRIVVLEQENAGAGAARNRGIQAARGALLTFVDSDDEIHPDAYSRVMRVMTDDVDAVCFGVTQRKDGGEFDTDYFRIPFRGVKTLDAEEVPRLSRTVWNKFFRRDCVLRHNICFPPRCSFDDNAFVFEYFMLYRRVFFLPDKLYTYDLHDGSLTNIAVNNSGGAFEYFKVIDYIYDFWMRNHILPQESLLFESLCIEFLRESMKICQPFEKAGIAWELIKRMKSWNMKIKDKNLRYLINGNYNIYASSGIHKLNLSDLKKLKGFEKILFIGNSKNEKVIRLFGREIIRWNRV